MKNEYIQKGLSVKYDILYACFEAMSRYVSQISFQRFENF